MKKIKSKIKKLIPIILAVTAILLCIPVSASAETINIKSGYGVLSSNALITRYSDSYPVDRLEQQYTYGGDYNPLILVDTKSVGYSWSEFDVSVYIPFNRTVPAGTILRISCGGWFQKSYQFGTNNPCMYASPYNIADVSNGSYENYLGSRVLLSTVTGSTVQTSNGNYRGYLFSGSYTTQFPMSGIYLCFSGVLSTSRTGGAYFGISCDSITISVDHVSPAESEIYNTPDTSEIDDYESQESAVLDGINDGLSDSKNLFTNFMNTFAPFIQGTMFMSNVISLIITGNEHINSLLTISLSLGMFGLLTNILSQSIKSSRDHIDKKGSTDKKKGSKK